MESRIGLIRSFKILEPTLLLEKSSSVPSSKKLPFRSFLEEKYIVSISFKKHKTTDRKKIETKGETKIKIHGIC